MRTGPITLCIDVGGTNIKASLLRSDGRAVGGRCVLPTPRPATPAAIVAALVEVARGFPLFHRVSVGFPAVVDNGVVTWCVNLDGRWTGFPLQRELARRWKVPLRVGNDADVQGFGAIAGKGVEVVLTLGTGVGSALFVDGRLVPNLEVGHHPFLEGRSYEDWLGMPALENHGLRAWNRLLARAVVELRKLFHFRCLYLGGGNSRLVAFKVPKDVKVVDNRAGVVGGIALWRE